MDPMSPTRGGEWSVSLMVLPAQLMSFLLLTNHDHVFLPVLLYIYYYTLRLSVAPGRAICWDP
ncbi:hypothetical protein M378DRAFT_154972 [Amanita muscaria Koide BX008]|uniref:Uncharacterized protein n=1 Tax=Amanita muscaria (strain Koide BX008) TaxID=946122 RepID=A0A0C2T602_AMAMK|nr:hypothetical protein M378DRAFT_154972 [Amanita muscaria Koide BX008]